MSTYNIKKEFLNKSNCGTGIIYNLETELFDVSLDIKTDNLIKVTWQELVDLKSLSALEPGVFYRITDYEFTSTDPEVINAGHKFDIIVLALSENMLSEDARAIQHDFTEEEKEIYSEEELHYFDASNLAAWKLKYSLEDTTRFNWAPGSYLDTIVFSSQYYGGSYDNYAYKRADYKDEQGYYAYEKYGDVVYIKSEKATFGEDIFIKNEFGEIVLKNPGKRYFIDAYALEIKSVDYVNNRTYFYIYDAYSGSITVDELDKNSLFYTDFYAFYIEETDPNKFLNKYVFLEFVERGYTQNTGWVITSLKRTYIKSSNGEFFEGIAAVWRDYVTTELPDDYVEKSPGEYVSSSGMLRRWYAGESLDYVKETKEAVKYRGTIYGMIDEYENDCEYDFKNALITGKYSLFDPELFYYTFTNQGSYYIKLKDGDTPVLLNPGTYTFLGCIPFRLYELSNYVTYVLPIITDEGYDSWDFYAALTNEEELDSETGETLYKVDMFVMPGNHSGNPGVSDSDLHLIRVFEDKKWYVKELIPNSNYVDGRKYIQVFSKDSNGNITVYETKIRKGYTEIFGEYLKTDRAWIYDACFKNNAQFKDFINLNINSSFTFDILEGLYNYGRNINYMTNYEEVQFVIDNNGCYGVLYKYPNKSYTIKWLKQGLPINVSGDNIAFATYEGTDCQFTNTVTITEPMYVYIKEHKLSEKSISFVYTGDLVLSPNKSLETNQITYDLYTTARDGEFYEYIPTIKKPEDTSRSYSDNLGVWSSDCYRVSLRLPMYSLWYISIPKVIMKSVLSSTIEASYAFLQDCYCVKARSGYNNGKYLFLKNVRFSNLQDADACILEDCYSITMEASLLCHIKDCSNTHIFNGEDANITSVADSILENVHGGNLCHIAKSRITNTFYSNVCGVVESDISGLYISNIENNNSYGNVSAWYNNYKNIYINSLKNKTVVLSDILNSNYTFYNSPGHCIHIRSEEDLTITV